ncbi:MAG TPA: aminotransferase class I/II-fold pyridoxal phosphate-dependent enzyme [Candidatus Eremiobacteraceae bacterium]|nr:aminotransferase class I/II-fold pyridoxal phosphate-dependent enzyme [Candidatus Eremiobacteraceae bacterium]
MQQPINRPASAPIYQSAGWIFRDLDEVDDVYENRVRGSVYGGSGSPNHWALEAALCELHEAPAALITAAGMSAFTAALLSLARVGTHVVAAHDLYGNTTRLLQDLQRFGVVTTLVDVSRHADVRAGLAQPNSMLIVETISNPRLQVADLGALANLARESGALLIVDNTLASPYHCKPLSFGASAVVESITKFLGGHHDLVLGSLLGSAELIAAAKTTAGRAGLIGPSFESWLATRSLAEYSLRMERSSANAQEIAAWLQGQPAVRRVHYPGLELSPSHAAAMATLQNGFGPVLSFEVNPDRQAVNRFLHALQRIKLVLSFGGAETTLSHPGTSSHRALSREAREQLGIHDGFLRLSVGVEDVADVIADLERGLSAF